MAAVPAAFVPVEALTPRWRRPRRPPPLGKLTDAERRELEEIEAELDREGVDRVRPRVRAECPPDDEPCPFVSCRHHLALDLTPTGKVRLRFPDREVWELEETCALRAANSEQMSAPEVAAKLNISRAQVHLDEVRAMKKLRAALEREQRRARRAGDG